jgi:hypothetical protein
MLQKPKHQRIVAARVENPETKSKTTAASSKREPRTHDEIFSKFDFHCFPIPEVTKFFWPNSTNEMTKSELRKRMGRQNCLTRCATFDYRPTRTREMFDSKVRQKISVWFYFTFRLPNPNETAASWPFFNIPTTRRSNSALIQPSPFTCMLNSLAPIHLHVKLTRAVSTRPLQAWQAFVFFLRKTGDLMRHSFSNLPSTRSRNELSAGLIEWFSTH